MSWISKEEINKERKITKRKTFRTEVFKRDDWICQSCLVKVIEGKVDYDHMATIDHIESLYYGGKSTIENCRTYCKTCNSCKNTLELFENFNFKLCYLVNRLALIHDTYIEEKETGFSASVGYYQKQYKVKLAEEKEYSVSEVLLLAYSQKLDEFLSYLEEIKNFETNWKDEWNGDRAADAGFDKYLYPIRGNRYPKKDRRLAKIYGQDITEALRIKNEV
jgi:hypothetical protein